MEDTFLHGKVVLLVMLPLSLQVSQLENEPFQAIAIAIVGCINLNAFSI